MRYALMVHISADGVHLILHQGYQRRDHYRGAFQHQCRKLIAQRLTATRGHQHEHIATRHKVVDHIVLTLLESVESEVIFQRLVYPCLVVLLILVSHD